MYCSSTCNNNLYYKLVSWECNGAWITCGQLSISDTCSLKHISSLNWCRLNSSYYPSAFRCYLFNHFEIFELNFTVLINCWSVLDFLVTVITKWKRYNVTNILIEVPTNLTAKFNNAELSIDVNIGKCQSY